MLGTLEGESFVTIAYPSGILPQLIGVCDMWLHCGWMSARTAYDNISKRPYIQLTVIFSLSHRDLNKTCLKNE